jgi:hypothetical protein
LSFGGRVEAVNQFDGDGAKGVAPVFDVDKAAIGAELWAAHCWVAGPRRAVRMGARAVDLSEVTRALHGELAAATIGASALAGGVSPLVRLCVSQR